MLEGEELKSQRLQKVIYGIHGVSWLIFFHISFDLTGLYYSFTDIVFNQSAFYFDEAFILIPFILLLFYWNSQFLIPKFITLKHWLRYIVYLFLSYLFISGFCLLLFVFLEDKGWYFQIEYEEFEDVVYTLFLVVILASLGLGIAKLALDNAEQVKVAKEKQKEAELNYLQAQVNPHFIFNSLNTIYALSVDEEADKTTDAILKFSELMSYPLHQASKTSTLLSEELAFINHYINLQRLKLGEDYPIEFDSVHEFDAVHVMPLSLIPLVENAFKYGVSHRYKSKIQFKIKKEEGCIVFESENKINPSKQVDSHQIGIENLKQRLNLYYKRTDLLDISQDRNEFKVRLKLPVDNLNEDSSK